MIVSIAVIWLSWLVNLGKWRVGGAFVGNFAETLTRILRQETDISIDRVCVNV